MAKTTKMAKEHSDTMRRAGKNWDGSKNEKLTKIAASNKRTNARSRAENAAMEKGYLKKQAGPPAKVKAQQKRINKIDIEEARGTGSVVKRGGKRVPVSPARAAAGRSRAGAMSSQLKKSNAAEIGRLTKLETKLKNAKTPAEKLKYRREIRSFREETGR
jgi:hypothetical protein